MEDADADSAGSVFKLKRRFKGLFQEHAGRSSENVLRFCRFLDKAFPSQSAALSKSEAFQKVKVKHVASFEKKELFLRHCIWTNFRLYASWLTPKVL